jgi:trehalose synthase
MFEVDLKARDVTPYVELVGAERVEELTRTADEVRAALGDRVVWNINSTAAGGGVAEMLHPQLSYARGLGIAVRWLVVEGPPEFFVVTKRLHNALHDTIGDGSELGAEQAALYERVSAENFRELGGRVKPGDVVVCHDPQTAGLVRHLLELGARVVWRCHIGHEESGAELQRGWAFLRKYVEPVHVAVFSRDAYAPSWLPRARAITLPPTIDPFSLKNRWLSDATARAILCVTDLVATTPCEREAATFVRDDGTTALVTRRATVFRSVRPPGPNVPLVVQVSRWDRMKDHAGLIEAFSRLLHILPSTRAELLLAGPVVGGVADDPEAGNVLQDVERIWLASPREVRERVHIAQLPMTDADENAAIVNALQRHATVIVQKSLREGFGLTVTEAMWKSRAVVASAVGGIVDQIEDGVHGLLVRDPTKRDEVAAALARVLGDGDLARSLGRAAHERVAHDYLMTGSLMRWSSLMRTLLDAPY